jgi:glutaredoxin
MNDALRNNLVNVFQETGIAHHEAFLDTDGEDSEWPLWYAQHLQGPLTDALRTPFTKSHLVYCVMDADFEHQACAPESNWHEFYAEQFIERYAPSATPAEDKLALYYSRTCPYCQLVLSAIDKLGIEVELLEIFDEPGYRDELVEARGRATVPVLRITAPDGEQRLMPESRDIVRYLKTLSAE